MRSPDGEPLLPAAELVAGRFVLRRRIASGGMGEVFAADDTATGRQVALKRMRPTQEPTRFEDECEVLRQLDHPAIVGYVAHGITEDGRPWLAMEWLEGEDLDARLVRSRPTLEEAVDWLRAIAEGVAAAHAVGIVHRDIKPSNIVLVPDRSSPVPSTVRPKLIDFGIARGGVARRADTQTGSLLGTPAYMAPEQARGDRHVDARADVFSIGCIAFECLSGKQAFVAENPFATIAKVLFEDPPPLVLVDAAVPRALSELVGRMLAKRPDDRPADASVVAAEVAAIAARLATASRSTPGPLSGIPARLGRRERRFVSVVMADTAAAVADPSALALIETMENDGGTLRRLVEEAVSPLGARLEWTDGGALCVLFSGADAKEQITRAAHAARAIRALLPDALVALATGRSEPGSVGEAIDRAADLLSRAPATGAGRAQADMPVLIDDVCAALLAERFVIGPAGDTLEGERTDALSSGARTLLGRPAPFVGRERDLRALRAMVDEVIEDQVARVALVVAPAGVGKSRLAHELVREIGEAGLVTEVWIARCDPISKGAALGIVTQLVRRTAGIFGNEDPSVARAKLLARVGKHVGRGDVARVAAFLGELVGAPFPDDATPRLAASRHDKGLAHDQIHRAFVDWVTAEATAAPVVLVLEDLHWADPASVKFIDAALGAASERTLFVLATARPEVAAAFPDLWATRHIHTLRLSELPRRAGERLVAAVLGDGGTPEIVARIVDRAAGNAFFLEELIRTVASGHADTLPETVLATVELRLEALPPEARQVLRAASVFGETFWRGAVAALVDGVASAALDELLRALLDTELVVRRPESRLAGEEELAFRHSIVRDAAYAALTDEDRTLGHRLAAEWLTAVGEREPLVLAEHFERGGEPERAVEWYVRATRQALGNDTRAVVAAAKRGIKCGAAGEALGELLYNQGEALFFLGEIAEASVCVQTALPYLRRGGAIWFTCVGGMLVIAGQFGDFDAAAPLLEDALEAEIEPEAYIDCARAMISNQFVQHATGRPAIARRFLARLLDVGRRAPGDAIIQGGVALGRALSARMLEPDPWAAAALAKTAMELYEEVGQSGHAAWATRERALACAITGAAYEAEAVLRAGILEARARGVMISEPMLSAELARVIAAQGDAREALDLVATACEAAGKIGDRVFAAAALVAAARAALLAGEPARARSIAEGALPLVQGAVYGSVLRAVIARAALDAGDAPAARAAASEAWALVANDGSIGWDDAFVALALRDALLASGEPEEARAVAAAAASRLSAIASRAPEDAQRRAFLDMPEHAALLAPAS